MGPARGDGEVWGDGEMGRWGDRKYFYSVYHTDEVHSIFLPRFPIPDSRLPTPDSRLPTPDSRLPIPDSPLRRL
ncbi:hypothetical protein [Moorena producens]|uniref:hypothetical protein n=1 Tax=Moorena producens TaxID=1155739 RepID=UPI0011EA6324|nr:hypothetical protein [Moorena producens]